MIRLILQFLFSPFESYEAKLFVLALAIWGGYYLVLVGFKL
ncbi:hypothetical protein [Yoonia sp.]